MPGTLYEIGFIGGTDMTMPKQAEMELPLLEVLVSLGGKAAPQQVYPLMTVKFQQLTQEDLDERIVSGINKWTNRIQWVRQKLIDKGDVISPTRGIWEITEQGRKRLSTVNPVPIIAQPLSLVETYENYEEDFKSQLLDRLHELSPRQFEEFAKKLLQVYGFVDLFVTAIGPDGGIDGYGRLKVGLATLNGDIVCKRCQGNVGSKEVQQFRGAIQGSYEQGIFFTTSDFTKQAKVSHFKKEQFQ